MVLSTTESLVLTALRDVDTQSFAVTEVALRMFYLMGEVIVDKVGKGGGKERGEGGSACCCCAAVDILYRVAILVGLKAVSRHGTG